MPRSTTGYINLRRALPPGRPVARLMARCLMLWTDLTLEYDGIGGDGGFDRMDRFDEFYRRLYFWRGNSRTLTSVKYLLDQLAAEPEFKSWLADAAPEHRSAFFEGKKNFDRHRQEVERVRNVIGAHLEQDAGLAIENLDEEEHDFMELNSTELIRATAARTLFVAALMTGQKRDEWDAAMRASMTELKEATVGAINALSTAVALYGEHYPLLPGGVQRIPRP